MADGVRTVRVVIDAVVELGPEELYEGVVDVGEQVRLDMENDPVLFLMDQVVDMEIREVVPS